MVKDDPRLVRKLQIPICLDQHPLPVADLRLNSDQALERLRLDSQESNRVTRLICNSSGAQLCNHSLSGRLGRPEALSKHLPALNSVTNTRTEQYRESRRHGTESRQTGEATGRSLDQHQVGNTNPCIDLKLNPVVAPTRSPDAADDGSNQLLLRVKAKVLQDFNPQRALADSLPCPNGILRPIPAWYRARSNRLTCW